MIIKNGEVFQEDGSFRLQDLYVENHRIVASEDEVTDKTIVDAAGLRVIPGLDRSDYDVIHIFTNECTNCFKLRSIVIVAVYKIKAVSSIF